MLAATSVALRLVGFRRWQGVLERLAPARPASSEVPSQLSLDRASRTARMVLAAERNALDRPNCLKRSLVLWWLLRRQRLAADLRIGARKQSGRLEAHSWVEHCGVVLNDSDDVHEHFAPFDGSITMASAEPQ